MSLNAPEPREERGTRRTILLVIVGAVAVVIAIFATRSSNIKQPGAVIPQTPPAAGDAVTPGSGTSPPASQTE
jgi:hypothetical protein